MRTTGQCPVVSPCISLFYESGGEKIRSQKKKNKVFFICNVHLSVFIAFSAYVGKGRRQPVQILGKLANGFKKKKKLQ